MKTRIASIAAYAIAASLSLTVTAHARNWFAVDGRTQQCVPSEQVPFGNSPAASIAMLRDAGIVPDVKVRKNDSLGTFVEITFTMADNVISFDYFTSIDTCETLVAEAEKSGLLPNLDDLK